MTLQMRRRALAVLQSVGRPLAVAAIAAAVGLGGCQTSEEPGGTGVPAPDTRVTEEGFVDHVAALNLAIEEGLTGDDAAGRVAALGAENYARDELEAYAVILRRDPERWARISRTINERVEEFRREPAADADDGADADGGADAGDTAGTPEDADATAPETRPGR
jgi:hypothetical protein